MGHKQILCIFSAKDLLKHRQKIIKLADQSEHGWKMVTEYEANPVASDSDDEKRIYKAEARASRKARSERGVRRGRWRGYPYRRGFGGRRMNETIPSTSQPQSQPTKRQGICFACHGEGHWKFECPSSKTTSNTNNKISSYSASLACKEINHGSDTTIQGKISGEESTKSSNVEVMVSPVGRLNKEIEKWVEITDDTYILDVIKHGYQLPLKDNPPGIVLRNNRSARNNITFVREEVKNLLERGVVSQVSEVPKVVNPLTVAYNKKGKPRLVLDCRHINHFLHTFKFKYEDIKLAEVMFENGSFLFTFDLKSAYHSIDINRKHRQLLGFAVQDGGKMKWYVFNSLPFGIASAGHIFTKVLRVVVAFWRAKGHRIIMFLDDGIGGAKNFDLAVRSSNFAKETLMSLGFLLAEEKCQWEPVQQAIWLGHYIDMQEAKLYITEERIRRLEIALESLLCQTERDQYSLIHVKVLASVVGQIISLQHVVGKKVRLLTRQMYKCILSRASWNAPIVVTEEAKSELMFWKTNARGINDKGKSLHGKAFYQLCIFADASSSGYGGFIEPYENVLISGSVVSDRKYGMCPEVDSSSISEGCINMLLDVGIKSPPEVGFERTPEVGSVENQEYDMSFLNGSTEAVIIKPTDTGKEVPPEEGSEMSRKVDSAVTKVKEKFLDVSMSLRQSGPVISGVERLVSIGNDDIFRTSSGRPKVCKGEDTTNFSKETRNVSGVVFGDWNDEEQLKSSTWRESETVRRVMKSNINVLKNKKIKVYSDNKNVQSVLQIGSRISELQEIACDINELCETNDITICPEWIPRGDNQLADDLSRFGDCDDWSVSDHVFNELDTKWGFHTFDRFASTYNTKCSRFNSRFWVPGTQGINGLDQQWRDEINWLVPPPRLILNCIKKLELEKANGTLIIPVWKSAPYWPELYDKNGSFKVFITEVIPLPSRNVTVKGRGNNGIFGREQLSFTMAAFKIRF